MNINELDELAKEWNRFDADNEYSQSFLELIAAYREAVAALEKEKMYQVANDGGCDASWILDALATAKRLGAE